MAKNSQEFSGCGAVRMPIHWGSHQLGTCHSTLVCRDRPVVFFIIPRFGEFSNQIPHPIALLWDTRTSGPESLLDLTRQSTQWTAGEPSLT